MAEPRFMIEGALLGPGMYELGPQEARHAIQVLRSRMGEWVIVFDGKGHSAEAEIVEIAKNRVVVRADGVNTEEHLPLKLTIATAIPKGKRWQILVEKCTELGVDRIVPLLTERSVSKGEGDSGKWKRWVIEAAKQSRRAWIPDIVEPVAFSSVLDLAREERAMLLAADSGGSHPHEFQDFFKRVPGVIVMVGPEGGFTEEELDECQEAGGKTIRLSPFVLRVETAAASVCAIIREMLL